MKTNLKVAEVMLSTDAFPVLNSSAFLKEALNSMNQFGLGIACIVSLEDKFLEGVITDGDLRRRLLKVQKPFSALLVDDALSHAIKKPITVTPECSLREAVEMMDNRKIWDLPVISDAKLVGLLHLHPAIDALLNSK